MVSRFLYFLFSPPAVVWALLSGAAWLWLRPASIRARRFLITAAVASMAASTYAVPATVSRVLTFRYRVFTAADAPAPPTALVVLGVGGETIRGLDAALTLTGATEAARVLETWRVFKLISPQWIVSSGGPPRAFPSASPSSVTMRDQLVRLGVPAERILLESTSRTTAEEAALIAPILQRLGMHAVVLVTSDIHMVRSQSAFRAQGIGTIPAIASDPYWSRPWDEWLLPTRQGLEMSGSVVHEVLGIPYYWLRGAL